MAPATLRRLLTPVAIFAGSRIVIGIALFVVGVLLPGASGLRLFFDWDGAHYLTIARDGYPPLFPPEGGYRAESAFFPLLAWLARWLDVASPLSLRASAVVVSLASATGGIAMVWALAADTLRDRPAATRAIVLLALWPASVTLTMFYSDSLLLLLGAACLLFLRREQWLAAGLAAMFATASRPNAIALAPACLFAAVMAWRSKRSLLPFMAPALAPLGMVGYFAFLYVRLGDFFLWFKAEKQGWGGGFDFGRHFVVDLVIGGLADPTGNVGSLFSGVAGLVGIALLVWALRARLPGEQVVFAAVALVLALGAGFGASLPRYVMNAFPLFFAPGRDLSNTATAVLAIFSAALLVAFTLIITMTRVMTP